uniref:GATA-type domain-containing protein n=1 Tax=Kwoniella pini CBS 10737 TaxID=1296096 RepID=A0A1B9I332_9TREE|nr:uncharacterized protein I206_04480 [Kwoniella pini CBS 10737]OCF49949.1 hypothetical protein I206_04480 [Kwoniella pini CBS 10737]
MSSTLAPNKIHSLPVRVSYYLPSTSQTFKTLFSTPQQVYVHPNTAASSTKHGEEEAWGSIYLKTVVMGVLMASPELHPAYANTPDLSLYVLDPRETYLRRSRAGSSPYISHSRIQAQPLQEVWTGKGLVSWALEEPGQGKNLITGRLIRSLDFANVAKSQDLSPLEALMMADAAGSSNEEQWGIEISVGLKSGISGPVGLPHSKVSSVTNIDNRPDAMRRSSTSSSTETNVSVKVHPYGPSNNLQRPQHPLPQRHDHVSAQPRRPHLPTPSSSSSAQQPLAPTRVVSASRSTPARPTDMKPSKSSGSISGSGGRKRRSKNTVPPPRNSLGPIDPNSDLLKRKSAAIPPPVKRSAPSSDAAEPFPTDIPAGLFAKPESLTREQAQRLLASPAFLSMLEKLTGAPIDAATAAKRAREGDDDQLEHHKRSKLSTGLGHSRKGSTDSLGETTHNAFVCWNCGRTKSAVWRTKVMDDGKSVRVCNACGLYWNKMGSMRPPTLWGDVDDDPKDRPRKDKKATSSAGPGPSTTAHRQLSIPPTSEPDIPAVRIDKPATRANDHGFKRTLSSVVEEDAKRIAALNHHVHLRKPLPKSNLHQTTKPVPMSSPPRGSTSATKSLREHKWDADQGAASSPVRWTDHNQLRSNTKSDNFHTDPIEPPNNNAQPDQENQTKNVQTLDMPLSDDTPAETQKIQAPHQQQQQQQQQINWGTDLSAFFDVEGFSMPPAHTLDQKTYGISPDVGPPTEFQRALSAEARKMRKQNQSGPSSSGTGHLKSDGTEEDDVLSQLFNRTSSVGPIESSPHPFDFSALPPSSPPVSSMGDLPHSALLLSSPDNSPLNANDFSPMDIKSNTPGKSRLRHSISANAIQQNQIPQMDYNDFQKMLDNLSTQHTPVGENKENINPSNQLQGNGYDMLNEIFGKLDQNQINQQATSSVGQADDLIGGGNGVGVDDIFAMLEGNAF